MKHPLHPAAGENNPGSPMIIGPKNLKEISSLYDIPVHTIKKLQDPF